MDERTFEPHLETSNDVIYTLYDYVNPDGNKCFFEIATMEQAREYYIVPDNKRVAQDFYAILWFEAGHGSLTVDFVDYEISENTMFFLSPKNIYSYKDLVMEKGLVICFSEDFLSFVSSNILNEIKYGIFYPPKGIASYHVSEKAYNNLHMLADSMMKHKQSNAFDIKFKYTYLSSLFTIFILDIMNDCNWQNIDLTRGLSDQYSMFFKFVKILENNFVSCHMAKEYAEKLGISQAALGIYTKMYAHMSPLCMINSRLVLEAKRMLAGTSLRIKEIAIHLNFEDVSYFSKVFKQYSNMSPGIFREKYKLAQFKSSGVAGGKANQKSCTHDTSPSIL